MTAPTLSLDQHNSSALVRALLDRVVALEADLATERDHARALAEEVEEQRGARNAADRAHGVIFAERDDLRLRAAEIAVFATHARRLLNAARVDLIRARESLHNKRAPDLARHCGGVADEILALLSKHEKEKTK